MAKKETIAVPLEDFNKLLARIEKLENPPVEVVVPLAEAPVELQATQYPLPPEYRDAVDQTLNKTFGVQLVPMSDTPAFQLHIVVPEKYSALTPDQRKMYGSDLRSKVITYAEGPNGVKAWAEKVFSSFNPEIKALIISDRVA